MKFNRISLLSLLFCAVILSVSSTTFSMEREAFKTTARINDLKKVISLYKQKQATALNVLDTFYKTIYEKNRAQVALKKLGLSLQTLRAEARKQYLQKTKNGQNKTKNNKKNQPSAKLTPKKRGSKQTDKQKKSPAKFAKIKNTITSKTPKKEKTRINKTKNTKVNRKIEKTTETKQNQTRTKKVVQNPELLPTVNSASNAQEIDLVLRPRDTVTAETKNGKESEITDQQDVNQNIGKQIVARTNIEGVHFIINPSAKLPDTPIILNIDGLSLNLTNQDAYKIVSDLEDNYVKTLSNQLQQELTTDEERQAVISHFAFAIHKALLSKNNNVAKNLAQIILPQVQKYQGPNAIVWRKFITQTLNRLTENRLDFVGPENLKD